MKGDYASWSRRYSSLSKPFSDLNCGKRVVMRFSGVALFTQPDPITLIRILEFGRPFVPMQEKQIGVARIVICQMSAGLPGCVRYLTG